MESMGPISLSGTRPSRHSEMLSRHADMAVSRCIMNVRQYRGVKEPVLAHGHRRPRHR
jgi:hypothetical protein